MTRTPSHRGHDPGPRRARSESAGNYHEAALASQSQAVSRPGDIGFYHLKARLSSARRRGLTPGQTESFDAGPPLIVGALGDLECGQSSYGPGPCRLLCLNSFPIPHGQGLAQPAVHNNLNHASDSRDSDMLLRRFHSLKIHFQVLCSISDECCKVHHILSSSKQGAFQQQKAHAKKRRRGGIEPLGRQPSPDLKSGPSASQAHRGIENDWKARVSIPVPLAC